MIFFFDLEENNSSLKLECFFKGKFLEFCFVCFPDSSLEAESGIGEESYSGQSQDSNLFNHCQPTTCCMGTLVNDGGRKKKKLLNNVVCMSFPFPFKTLKDVMSGIELKNICKSR